MNLDAFREQAKEGLQKGFEFYVPDTQTGAFKRYLTELQHIPFSEEIGDTILKTVKKPNWFMRVFFNQKIKSYWDYAAHGDLLPEDFPGPGEGNYLDITGFIVGNTMEIVNEYSDNM